MSSSTKSSSSSPTKPFDILTELAKRSIRYAKGLPAQDKAVELWNGIGFTIADIHFVSAMGTVTEILHVPKFTTIPGVKNWMLGVANVRGRLLPVIDLARFFGLNHSSLSSRDKRVLVVEHDEVFSGFIVDSVQGMQYFSAESFQSEIPKSLDPVIKPYVRGVYLKNETQWNVFDTFVLTDDNKFLDVAVR